MPSIQSYSSTRDGDGKAYSWDDPTSPQAVLNAAGILPSDTIGSTQINDFPSEQPEKSGSKGDNPAGGTEGKADGAGGDSSAYVGLTDASLGVPQEGEIDTCRPLMADPQRWQSYVNETVFGDVGRVAMSPPYKVDTGTQSSDDFLDALQKAGWWWPANRPNLNPEHSGGRNLEREVQSGKWIHITIFPGQTKVTTRFLGIKTGTKMADDWSKPPREIQLHCERYWLQPSSNAHLKDFLREKTKLPF
jgi:hypothetical protein